MFRQVHFDFDSFSITVEGVRCGALPYAPSHVMEFMLVTPLRLVSVPLHQAGGTPRTRKRSWRADIVSPAARLGVFKTGFVQV